jgi:hypothetical protein
MKTILNKDFTLNEIGKQLDSTLKNSLRAILSDYTTSGYNILELQFVVQNILHELTNNNIAFLNNYYQNRLHNTENLDIMSSYGGIKKAKFHSYGKNHYRYWVYEVGWTPTLPYGIKEVDGEKLWYLSLDIDDTLD